MSTDLDLNNSQFINNNIWAMAQNAVKYCNDAVQFINNLGKSIYHNNAFVNLLGYSVEQLNNIGGPFAIFAEPDLPKTIINHLEYRDSWEGNVNLYDNNGLLVPAHLHATTVKDKSFDVFTTIYVYHTSSPLLKNFSGYNHYFRKIEEAEKLARLGYFSSAISHEINNPLNIIQTKLFFLKRRLTQIYPEKNDECWEHLEKMNQQIIRLSNLANSILQYAKHSVKRDFLVNINQIILHTVNTLTEFIPRSIKIDVNLDSGLYLVPADETGLEIVLKNLIFNAMESILTEGQIIISTKNFNDQFIEVRIQDNGVGIPEESLSKIFNPFYTSKSKSGSYGLGLSLCENIINEHNGQIILTSKVNVGSDFIIHLPCT